MTQRRASHSWENMIDCFALLFFQPAAQHRDSVLAQRGTALFASLSLAPYVSGRAERDVFTTKAKNLCSDASCRSSGWKIRRWNCPVATVVISDNGEGDQAVESSEVKVSLKGGKQLSRS